MVRRRPCLLPLHQHLGSWWAATADGGTSRTSALTSASRRVVWAGGGTSRTSALTSDYVLLNLGSEQCVYHNVVLNNKLPNCGVVINLFGCNIILVLYHLVFCDEMVLYDVEMYDMARVTSRKRTRVITKQQVDRSRLTR